MKGKPTDIPAEFRRLQGLAPKARSAALAQIAEVDPTAEKELSSLLNQLETQSLIGKRLRAYVQGAALGNSEDIRRRLAEQSPPQGRYELGEEVARGGMGVIRVVQDKSLRRTMVMKIPKSELAADMLLRFIEEAEVTGQLDHPSIVPVHDLGIDAEGRVYYTMPLVKGRNLREVLELLKKGEEGWTRTRVLGVILKVCEAMAYAHAKGVVHRDLKPDNVMVGRFGAVYVMDWGLAKVVGREDPDELELQPAATALLQTVRNDDELEHTGEYTAMGTPSYMPLEQAEGRVLGPSADVYSVGAILYRLLTGQNPYVRRGARPTPEVVLASLLQGKPDPIESLTDDAPVELVAICEKAMERDPESRYPDMSALGADLSAFLEQRVVSAYETGAMAELRKWVRRNKPLAASLAAVAVALSAGLAVSLALRQQAVDNEKLANEYADRAKEQKRIADEQRARADDKAAEAARKRDEVLQLSALQDVEDLLVEVGALWPARPEKIDAFDAWMSQARKLTSKLPEHRAKRSELRANALPRNEEELDVLDGELLFRRRALARRRDGVAAKTRVVDRAGYPDDPSALITRAWELVKPDRKRFGDEDLGLALALQAHERAEGERVASSGNTLAWAWFALGEDDLALNTMFDALDSLDADTGDGKHAEFEGYLQELEAAVEAATSDEALAREAEHIAELEFERSELDKLLDERRDWRFPDGKEESRWWNNQLTELIGELERLERDLLDPEAVTELHGWSVAKRRDFAEALRTGFAPGGAYATRWERSLPALREAYPDLELAPQMALVPLGADPASGLWEFGELTTGTPPVRDGEGQLLFEEGSGLVFVLLPGGTFQMGSQNTDPAGGNYDPDKESNEGPVHEVELSPYFISKYEMTQAQWERITGHNPSHYPPGKLSVKPTNPVEQVSWWTCTSVLEHLGLTLPTEAQWEYAARGGTTTPWWTGSERESLRVKKAANLADQAAERFGASWPAISDWPDLDDGCAVHTPVDSFTANGFQLYHVHGNVWEWCADGYSSYPANRVADPFVDPIGHSYRVLRGGSFCHSATFARSTYRDLYSKPVFADLSLGLRPALDLRKP